MPGSAVRAITLDLLALTIVWEAGTVRMPLREEWKDLPRVTPPMAEPQSHAFWFHCLTPASPSLGHHRYRKPWTVFRVH